MTLNWQKRYFCQFFVTFWKRVLSHFKYIFVFCQFFATFFNIFVSFLSQFGFSKFNHLLIIQLQSFVNFLSDFWDFFLHFCHILEIAWPHMNTSTVLIGYYDYHPVTKSPKIGCYDSSQIPVYYSRIFALWQLSACDYFLAVSRGSHNIR